MSYLCNVIHEGQAGSGDPVQIAAKESNTMKKKG